MKRIISVFLILAMLSGSMICFAGGPEEEGGEAAPVSLSFDADARSAVLMEASTGRVLYTKNENEPLPPASVTKVMTLLLVMEAIDGGKIGWSDPVQASAHAAEMGGSQIFLKAGEVMTVEDLVKSVVIASANDAAMALAEFVAGSEEGFVARMNERAKELGLENTHFENPTGLDDDVKNHVFSALDIALCSRELMTKHPKILDYSSIWMDTVRDGAFGLSNTNRLIRFYNGANGLKTGSTSKAKFCISAAAKRDGMQLIAVVMGSETRDRRNETAKKLLDYGFASYELKVFPAEALPAVPVTGGEAEEVKVRYEGSEFLLEKGQGEKAEREVLLPDTLTAPVEAGEQIGTVVYRLNGEKLGEVPIVTEETVGRIGYGQLLKQLVRAFFLSTAATASQR